MHAHTATTPSTAPRPRAAAVPRQPAPARQRGHLNCACGGRCPQCAPAAPWRGLAQRALQSASRPLAADTRAAMEPLLGHRFDNVRVHDDAAAADSARALTAQAWTWGEHVVFDRGRYRPDTPRGAALLAHELVHVQQHAGVVDRLPPTELAARDGAAEREADSAVRSLAGGGRLEAPARRAAAPRVQRSFGSALLDVLLFVPRLFGAGGFPAGQLREYLDGLKQRKGPAKTLFSDNKARACVARESELGPYDTDTKIWLVQDMIDGWTTWLDEDAIIALLRRSADRDRVVAAVGRDTLWNNFSGGNRRQIEAITLTAADAGDALVSRLRSMSAGHIQDYIGNATDPAVRAAATKALALTNITAPVPVAAAVSAAGHADFTINGVKITVEPDRYDASVGDHAFTHSSFVTPQLGEIPETPENAGSTMEETEPLEITLTLWTTYASPEAKGGPSGYGVGTRPGDEKTLQAHERGHGQGWFDFLRDNPPPRFQGRAGMTVAEYNAAARRWNADCEDYKRRAGEFSLRAGDCVAGGKMPTDEQLQGTGYTAAICHQP